MKQSIYIGGIVSLQLLTAIVTQLLVIKTIGVGSETDVYIAAQTGPSIVSAIVITALQSVWLPRLSVLSENASSWRNEQAVAQGQGLMLGAGITLFIYLLLPVLIPHAFTGFSEDQIQRTIFFSSPLLLAAVFNIQAALLTVALRAKNKFIVAELVSMFVAIFGMVGVIFFLPKYGIEAVVYIALIRSVIGYMMQMYFARWPMPLFIKGWQCKTTWKMMRPLLLGTSLYKTSPLVDRYWLSQVSNGGITIYSLAQTIMGMMSIILERVISMPLTPSFARYVAGFDYEGLKKAYRRGIRKTIIAVIFVAALLFLMKPIIMMSLIQLLNLEQEVSANIWLVCVLLLGYLYGAVSGSISVAVFYSLSDSKTPVYIGLFGFLVGFILKWVLFDLSGVFGIALATSCLLIINLIVLDVLVSKKIKKVICEKV